MISKASGSTPVTRAKAPHGKAAARVKGLSRSSHRFADSTFDSARMHVQAAVIPPSVQSRISNALLGNEGVMSDVMPRLVAEYGEATVCWALAARIEAMRDDFAKMCRRAAVPEGYLDRISGNLGVFKLVPEDARPAGEAAIHAAHARTYRDFELQKVTALKTLQNAHEALKVLPPDRDALRGVATLALLRSVAQLTAQVKVSEHLVDLSKDRVEAIEDALGTTDDLLEPLALLAQHVGSRALKLFMSGDAEGALSTLQLLAKNRGLFGMNAAQARRAIKSLDGLMKAPQGPAAAAKVWDFKAQTSSFEGPASNALQALAVAFALPGLIADGTGLKDGSPEERANLVGDFLGNGGDGVSLVSSILNGANLTETVANMTSGVGGLIGAVLDGREAILDAKAHKAWMSVTHATSSVGGSILAAQAFPFIPQILSGAESAVAGVALGAFALGSEYARKAMLENRLERATAVYLMGAGVDSKPATELSRIVQGRGIEPFVQVAAKKLRVTPLDLFEKLLAQPEGVQKEFARIALSTRLAPAKGLREKLAAKATIKKPYTVDQGLAELRKLGFEPGPTR